MSEDGRICNQIQTFSGSESQFQKKSIVKYNYARS